MKPTAQKGNILLYLSFVVAAIMVAIGGYYFGLQQGLKEKASVPRPSTISQGFQKAENLLKTNSPLIIRTGIQFVYTGTLKSMEPDKSWTIERNGRMLTILSEGKTPEYLTRVRKGSEREAQLVTSDRIKIGDDVTISVFLDPVSGKTNYIGITLLLSPEPSPPSGETSGE